MSARRPDAPAGIRQLTSKLATPNLHQTGQRSLRKSAFLGPVHHGGYAEFALAEIHSNTYKGSLPVFLFLGCETMGRRASVAGRAFNGEATGHSGWKRAANITLKARPGLRPAPDGPGKPADIRHVFFFVTRKSNKLLPKPSIQTQLLVPPRPSVVSSVSVVQYPPTTLSATPQIALPRPAKL